MRLKFSKNTSKRVVNRIKKKVRVRKTVLGTPTRPRLSVYKSNTNLYAQVIDDVNGKTLVSASSLKINEKGKVAAQKVGENVAKIALENKIKSVVFDRNGFIYHGRIKAVADGARGAGLKF